MNKFIFWITVATLIFISLETQAQRIIINGQPVILEDRSGVYYYPSGVAPPTTASYYYYNIDNSNKVCYAETQPGLQTPASTVNVMVGGTVEQLTCYNADPNYFMLQP